MDDPMFVKRWLVCAETCTEFDCIYNRKEDADLVCDRLNKIPSNVRRVVTPILHYVGDGYERSLIP
jgi:hypothetical protein